MKKQTLGLLLSWALVNIALAQTPVEKAKSILDAVKKKYQAMTAFKANFLYTLDSPTAGTTESLKGEITIRGKMFYLKMPNQEIITDAKNQWLYLKESNEVNLTSYEPDPDEITPDRIYTIYETNYEYAYVEQRTEQGKKYHIIDLKPKNFKEARFHKIRLKIVADGNSIKSWELFEKNQNRYLYTITRFATVQVGEGYFKYNAANFPSKPKLVDLR